MNWGLMMTDKKQKPQNANDAMLEHLFSAAKPTVSDQHDTDDDFMARMLGAAFDVQDDVAGVSGEPIIRAEIPRRSALAAFLDAIGGWPSLSGMAVATLAGVWIGTAQPVALNGFNLTTLADTESVALAEDFGFSSGFDSLQEEG